MRLAVLVTCHNRASVSARNLGSLVQILNAREQLSYEIVAVDDGSTDGTADALIRLSDTLTVVQGTGDLYWNRGMCLSFEVARKSGRWDAYLLFNDDVDVFPEAVEAFLDRWEEASDTYGFMVGATRDGEGFTSYSGLRMISRRRPLHLKRVEPESCLLPVDTFNANFVIARAGVLEQLGGLDPVYLHSLGDIDLGLRAAQAGYRSALFSCHIGRCDRDRPANVRYLRQSRKARLMSLVRGPSAVRYQVYFYWQHLSRLDALAHSAVLLGRHAIGLLIGRGGK